MTRYFGGGYAGSVGRPSKRRTNSLEYSNADFVQTSSPMAARYAEAARGEAANVFFPSPSPTPAAQAAKPSRSMHPFDLGVQGLRLAARTGAISPQMADERTCAQAFAHLEGLLVDSHVFKFDTAATEKVAQLSRRTALLADRLHQIALPFPTILIEMDNKAALFARDPGTIWMADSPPWNGFLVQQSPQGRLKIGTVAPCIDNSGMYGLSPFDYVIDPNYAMINETSPLILDVLEQLAAGDMRIVDKNDGRRVETQASAADREAAMQRMEERLVLYSEASRHPRQQGLALALAFGSSIEEDVPAAVRIIEHTALQFNGHVGRVVKALLTGGDKLVSFYIGDEAFRNQPARQAGLRQITRDLLEQGGDLPLALAALVSLDLERRGVPGPLAYGPAKRPAGRLRRGAVTAPYMVEQTVKISLEGRQPPSWPVLPGTGSPQGQHDVRGHWCYRAALRKPSCFHHYEVIEPPPPEGVNHRQRCRLCGEVRWWRRKHVRGDPRFGSTRTNYEVTP